MYYLVQENIFGERHHETLLHNLERLGLDYELVKLVPFENTIEFKTKRKDIFVFGAIKIAHIAEKYGFKPGSMYNENHDFEVYGPIYGKNMLNHDSMILNLKDPLPDYDKWIMFFGRSCGDNKIIPGQVFMNHSWEEYISGLLIRKKRVEWETEEEMDERLEILGNSKVMISPLKEIYQEIRCWVVGGKIITISQYKLGKRVTYKNLDDDQEAWNFAQSMVDIYQPAEAFVLDICRVECGFKIVEINCINCSGFYDSNLQKLLIALEEKFINMGKTG